MTETSLLSLCLGPFACTAMEVRTVCIWSLNWCMATFATTEGEEGLPKDEADREDGRAMRWEKPDPGVALSTWIQKAGFFSVLGINTFSFPFIYFELDSHHLQPYKG